MSLSLAINPDDIEVAIILKDHPNVLAQAEVVIPELIKMVGWTVRLSNYSQLRVMPPCQKGSGGRYFQLLRILNPELYKIIQSKIITQYQQEKHGQTGNGTGGQEFVDVDEIPDFSVR